MQSTILKLSLVVALFAAPGLVRADDTEEFSLAQYAVSADGYNGETELAEQRVQQLRLRCREFDELKTIDAHRIFELHRLHADIGLRAHGTPPSSSRRCMRRKRLL